MECDTSIVIDVLNNHNLPPWHQTNVYKDIFELVKLFDNIHFAHDVREANKATE